MVVVQIVIGWIRIVMNHTKEKIANPTLTAKSTPVKKVYLLKMITPSKEAQMEA